MEEGAPAQESILFQQQISERIRVQAGERRLRLLRMPGTTFCIS